MWNEIFDEFLENLLQTKAVLISSLNVSIMLWSLGKNREYEQILMSQIESCATQQI